jgi:hypothetical protein
LVIAISLFLIILIRIVFLSLSVKCEDFDFNRLRNMNLKRRLVYYHESDSMIFNLASCEYTFGSNSLGVCEPWCLLSWVDSTSENKIWLTFFYNLSEPEELNAKISFNFIHQYAIFYSTEVSPPYTDHFAYGEHELSNKETLKYDFVVRDFMIQSIIDSIGMTWTLVNADDMISLSNMTCECQ